VNDTIAVYKVDPATRLLSVAGPPIPTGLDPAYGFCMYRQPSNGAVYAVANDQDGNVKQWLLVDGGLGQVVGHLVRSFSVGSQTEGMVADDELGWLYISEESVGIWRYGAAPWAGIDRTLVDSAEGGGQLTADVEGLAIYYGAHGAGYLIASSQGSSTFVVYGRGSANPYVVTFHVTSGNGIDEVTGTDGIDVTNVNLGPLFPLGTFIAQDDSNPGANQNFKLVRWESIALAAPQPLLIDTASWDPRAILGDVNGDDGVDVVDMLLLLNGWGPCAQCSACPADVDDDCQVTVSDLLILLINWG
jgi:3-phytase